MPPGQQPILENRYRSRSPITSWRLDFDGTSNSMAIEEFIYRIEKFKNLDQVPDAYITQNLHRMLSGTALRWYWIFEKDHPFDTWNIYRAALLQHFGGIPSEAQDDEIISQIVHRRQGPKENVDEFYTAILELNNRLTVRRSEAALIRHMKRNLLPKLSEACVSAPGHSLEQFRTFCQDVETTRFRNQQLRYDSRVVHELPYEDEDSAEILAAFHRRNRSATPRTYDTSNYVCWNCDQLGHSFRECLQEIQGTFCYTCGAKGVVSPRCQKCHPENSETLLRTNRDGRPPTSAPTSKNRVQVPSQKPAP